MRRKIMRKTDDCWDIGMPFACCITSCPQGSCTEAMVQHIASERFISTPHGWSRRIINALASLRVFRLNGGSLQDLQTGQPTGTYACYINDCVARIKEQHFDFPHL